MIRHEFKASITLPFEVSADELDMFLYRQMKHVEYPVNVIDILSAEEAGDDE